MGESCQELVEFLLAIGKFSSAAIVDAEATHDAVDDQEAIFATHEIRRKRVQQL